MNYLAHVFLAANNPHAILGNLLGDFIKGRLENYSNIYNSVIIGGLQHHRDLDCFTDRHQIYQESKKKISAENRRYSGVIIDIYYDHFLAKNWLNFSEENLEDFTQKIYQILLDNYAILPVKLQNALPIMLKENWLLSYQTIEGINITFARLSRRIKRENHLPQATQDLITNYTQLELEFLAFFPEIMAFSESIKK